MVGGRSDPPSIQTPHVAIAPFSPARPSLHSVSASGSRRYTLIPVGLFGWILIGVQHAADRIECPFQRGEVDSLKLDSFCKIIKSQCLKISSRHRYAWRFTGGHDPRIAHVVDSVQTDIAPIVSPNPQCPLQSLGQQLGPTVTPTVTPAGPTSNQYWSVV